MPHTLTRRYASSRQSVVYGFSLFHRLVGFEFVDKLASVGAVFRTLVLWRWKFRALPQSIFAQGRA
ncbi:hypothetical protein ACSTD8_21990 [Vibrio vulnificus]|uniref:hypothetical protein n=1 Tax=Vibrio vulnificus TaxID=672 RepID=UPI003ED90588